MTSRPSSIACSRTTPDPGTTIAVTLGATLRPLATAATARMSSMRPLVQEPMKTLSIGMEVRGLPCDPSRPMYPRARSIWAFLTGSSTPSSDGTRPVIGAVCSGDVPHVTVGAIDAASMMTVRSYSAPGSEASDFQCSMALAHSGESGAGTMGRPLRYSKVISSGAMRPARAPASMAMLQMDMRPSIEMLRMASPANSIV
mmetsp:Transcript_11305/g.34864  ORF Transcript_11305/g.34864 Transcript_11305/m.34864 type:complete len:200 (-) Transcript_11305:793-1392(-)